MADVGLLEQCRNAYHYSGVKTACDIGDMKLGSCGRGVDERSEWE